MAAHRGDLEPEEQGLVLIAAADALSAARPGAKALDAYIKAGKTRRKLPIPLRALKSPLRSGWTWKFVSSPNRKRLRWKKVVFAFLWQGFKKGESELGQYRGRSESMLSEKPLTMKVKACFHFLRETRIRSRRSKKKQALEGRIGNLHLLQIYVVYIRKVERKENLWTDILPREM